MPQRYQIHRQKAIQKFRHLVAEQNPTIQLLLPMSEVVSLLQEGVGNLLREAGLQLMCLIMEEEVRQLAGERNRPDRQRRAYRWGNEAGHCVVDGQKIPIRRPRVRDRQNGEQRLGSYELFRRPGPLEPAVWERMIRGLSTRNYGAVVKEFAEAYGVEKSATSGHFIQASRQKLQELLERPLGQLRLCALVIDGTPFKNTNMVVVLGIGCDGQKTVLGLREGATENATVVGELLEDLAARGLDFSVPRLYVLDGSKALLAAVRRHAGEAALIQRCQIHKKRNVLDHLPQEHRRLVQQKLNNAYAMAEYAEAQRALDRLHRKLMDLNPSAARSLAEGLEETLTVHKLRVPASLRKTLASTNVIESAFSIVEMICRNVKRWRGGDHLERWVGSALLVAEKKFRRVRGYQQIPQLLGALTAPLSKKGVASVAGAA